MFNLLKKKKEEEPDYALEAKRANSTFGLIKNTILGIPKAAKDLAVKEFSIRDEPVETRRMFEAEPIKTKAPPIVTQLSSLGVGIVEAIPKAAATVYGEFFSPKEQRKAGVVKLPVNAKALGFQDSEYHTAAKEVQDEVKRGTPIGIAALKVFSEKTLDVAFGTQLTGQLLKTAEKQLLKGGIESKLSAWDALGKPATIEEAQVNKVAQTTKAFEATKNMSLATREKVVSEINNTLNKAVKTLKKEGIPTITDQAKLKVARVAEVASRETSVDLTKTIGEGKNAKTILNPNLKAEAKEFLKPDIKMKTTPLTKAPIAGELPGYREREGQAPAFGLSTKEVEAVGGAGERKITDALYKEAKKYKSAEEFVNKKLPNKPVKTTPDNYGDTKTFKVLEQSWNNKEASVVMPKGSKVFRGGEEGVYHSADLGTAEGYAEGGAVNSIDISGKKLANFQKFTNGKYASDPEVDLKGILKKALNEGYDGLYTRDNYGEVILPTKSQLTDIWNKAVGKKDVSKGIIKEPLETRKANLEKEGYIQPKENVSPKQVDEIEKVVKETESNLREVDKLIAKGEIRVVRRDNKDVYQIKKGKEWVNVRDEDSAVKQVTAEPKKPKPKVYAPKDQEKLDYNKSMLEMTRERLADHPARPILKFINRKEGEFLDFKNPNNAKTETEAKRIQAKNDKIFREAENAFADNPKLADSFDNPDTIREVIEDYKNQREVEKILVATKNSLEKSLIPLSQQKLSAEILQNYQPIDVTDGEGRAMEISAEQALSFLNGEYSPMNISFPQKIAQTITPVQKKVHIIDTYLTTPRLVMEKIGFGKEADMLREGADGYWKELPKNIDKVNGFLERLKDDKAKLAVFRWLDGKAVTLSTGEKEVALEIKDWLKEWAKRLDLPEDNTIKHYITHIFEAELIEKEFDEELAKVISDKIPGEVYDPFLEKRLGVRGYKEDLGLALDAYVKRATRKVHLDPPLEAIKDKAGASLEYTNLEKSQFNYIQKYIENINMRPSEAEEGVDNFIKSIVGYRFGQRPTIRALTFLRQATFRGMLGLNPTSALRNLSQGINTYAELGEKYTALGYMGLFRKGAMEELAREGVLNAGFVQDRALTATKKAIEKMDKVLFAFFDTAEKINRGAAYFGAKQKAISQGISEIEAIKYAKGVVRKTQFSFDTVDTPVGLGGQGAKTLLQFQTFTVKQSEFLWNKIKRTFKGQKKMENFLGLLRYSLAGMAFIYSIGRAFGMQPKELLPMFRFDTPPSLKLPVELTKAAVNAPDKYGNKRDIEKKAEDVGNAAIGLFPGGNQIKKTLQGIQAVQDGGVKDKAGNLKFKSDGTTAEKVQAILFGKYASREAKQYFKGKTVAEIELEKLKKLPKAEALAKLKEYQKTEPSLFRRIKDLREDELLGMTDKDKEIRNMGVENGQRAEYIYNKAKKMNKEKATAYLADLRKKKVISDEVLKQIVKLKREDVAE